MRLSGLTVLVVEDDADNLELLSSHVESEGAMALSAASIAAALSVSADCQVDIALCDLELADGDGCELVRQLRKRSGCENLPAVALTGYSDERWRQKASACGFNRYAVKPFPLDQLTDWLVELGSTTRLACP
jgi:two-component system, chemotaxis family, CheB/CheR fusion protein